MNEQATIRIEIEQAREWVRKAECLTRLETNPDFQVLIEEGYFKEEAARIVGLKADPNFVFAGKEQMDFLNILENGVGALAQYFRQIRMQAQSAEAGLAEMEDLEVDIAREVLEGEA